MYWNRIMTFEKNESDYRLTLTWDVLKYNFKDDLVFDYNGLTLTWDVLK